MVFLPYFDFFVDLESISDLVGYFLYSLHSFLSSFIDFFWSRSQALSVVGKARGLETQGVTGYADRWSSVQDNRVVTPKPLVSLLGLIKYALI